MTHRLPEPRRAPRSGGFQSAGPLTYMTRGPSGGMGPVRTLGWGHEHSALRVRIAGARQPVHEF